MDAQGNKAALVVYAWDGRSKPLERVARDADPVFDVILFDYSGTAPAGPLAPFPVLSCKTECKGEIFREVHAYLSAIPDHYGYVGLIDDDIALAWSDLNRLLALAAEHRLDSFQAALSADSYHAHRRVLVRPGGTLRRVPWVEVMMPFYRTGLFLAGGDYYADSISSYGLDQFAMPVLQKLAGLERVAVVDAVSVRHIRPITSDGKVFANGLTAHQERVVQRRRAMRQVRRERPDLVGTGWYLRTFAPLDGPGRFWPLWLAAPWLWISGNLNRR